jgi:NAD+-dependent secondary alcohol dehydrogenase Adh1
VAAIAVLSGTSLEFAKQSRADHLVKADGNEVEAVLSLTGNAGAEAVIDFVAEKGTTAKGLAMTRPMGNCYIVGYGEDIRITSAAIWWF